MDVVTKTVKFSLLMLSLNFMACTLAPNKHYKQIEQDEKAQGTGEKLVELMRRRDAVRFK